MFSELPKLFERNFAMAFFMPVAIFIGASQLILDAFQLTQALPTLEFETLLGATVIVLVSWLGGILLLVTNRDMYRVMEGYGKYNPVRLIGRLQKRRFRKLNEKLDKLDDQFRELGSDFPVDKRSERNKIMKELAEHFPDDERWLLPTGFGNTLRAFETYPRVMYGVEAIDGWSRILAVVPEEYRSLIDNAKAHVDFWVNMGFVSVFLLVEYLSIALSQHSWKVIWLLVLIVLALLVSPYRAKRVAVEWGDLVKSVFDLYRFDLLEALGIELPKSRKEERGLWTKISQAIIYRLPDTLPEIKPSQKKKGKKG
jgi:hypothetical protein